MDGDAWTEAHDGQKFWILDAEGRKPLMVDMAGMTGWLLSSERSQTSHIGYSVFANIHVRTAFFPRRVSEANDADLFATLVWGPGISERRYPHPKWADARNAHRKIVVILRKIATGEVYVSAESVDEALSTMSKRTAAR